MDGSLHPVWWLLQAVCQRVSCEVGGLKEAGKTWLLTAAEVISIER